MSTPQIPDDPRPLVTGKITDVILSRDGKTAYVANADGWVNAVSLANGNLVGRWQVGTSLGGMSLSQDGAYLVATEQKITGETGSGASYRATFTVHVLDLSTGVVRNFANTEDGNAGAYTDAQFTSDGKILLSQKADGLNPLSLLDPATGAFAHLSSPDYAHVSTLTANADGSVILFGEGGLNQLSVYTYKAGAGATLIHGWTDAGGSNTGVQAISADGSAILVDNTFYKNGQKLFLPPVQPELGLTSGWAFSPDGQHAYALDAGRGMILQLSTSDWSIERALPSGLPTTSLPFIDGVYGDRLSATADGKYLVVLGSDAVLAINLQSVGTLGGTDKADVITAGYDGQALYGFAGDDVLIGGHGDDSLHGGAGNDILNGGPGLDLLDGGDGVDTADYSTAAAAVEVSLYFNYAIETPGHPAETLISIENVIGSRFDDLIQGDNGANRLEGGDGADHIAGFGGNDVLLGGAGDDVLDGGPGDDVLDGGAGFNTASFQMSDGGVTVDLGIAGPQNTGGAGTDTLINIQGLTGSIFNDVLKGDGRANVFEGSGGDDQIFGGDGEDTARYSGFSWNYSVVQNADGSTTVKDLRAGSPDGTDTLWSIEHIVFGPTASESALRAEMAPMLRLDDTVALSGDQQSLLQQWQAGTLNAD